MAKSTVPKLDIIPFKNLTAFVTKTNEPLENRIDKAFPKASSHMIRHLLGEWGASLPGHAERINWRGEHATL
jgi:hypothetical protein